MRITQTSKCLRINKRSSGNSYLQATDSDDVVICLKRPLKVESGDGDGDSADEDGNAETEVSNELDLEGIQL